MGFEEFKEKIVEGLQEIYGDSAEIVTGIALKNNGSKYHGISIFLKGSGNKTCPVIDLDRFYRLFENGTLNIGDCVREIYNSRKALNSPEGAEQFAKNISEWEYVKDDIYPILLSTEENSKLLERIVYTPILDLAVAYIIRGEISGETVSVKITKELMMSYEITPGQLHRQAMVNMEKDGYEFIELESLIRSMDPKRVRFEERDEEDKPEMYVLTNSAKSYGAAVILNKKLIREFAGDRDFFILPSSIHDMIFVPVDNDKDQGFYDEMVTEVNKAQVSVEEKLTDHSYYYDAANSEIRMCA